MTHVVTTDVTNFQNSSSANAVNENIHKLRDEFEKVVYKDGSEELTNDLDANSQRIYNLGVPVNPSDAARLQDVIDIPKGPKGDPGGNVLAVGSFTQMRLGLTVIPSGASMVYTSYHTYPSQGSAKYVRNDTLVTVVFAANNPLTTFRAPDETGTVHGYVLAESVPDISQFGVFYTAFNTVPSKTIQTQNSIAFEDACAFALHGRNDNSIQAWRSSPIAVSGAAWLDPDRPIVIFRTLVGGSLTIQGSGHIFCGLYWQTSDIHVVPLIGIPEGYINGQDDKLYLRNGTVAPAGTIGGTGRTLNISGLTLNGGYGKHVTVLNTVNFQNCAFRDLTIHSAHRGFFNSQSFDHTYENVRLEGFYYNIGRGQADIEVDVSLNRSFMIYSDGQTTYTNTSGRGFGVALSLNGSFTVLFTRFEQGEKAFLLGDKSYAWDTWNGSSFINSVLPYGFITAAQTESCYKGIDIVTAGTGIKILNSGITGFAGAVVDIGYGPRAPYYGIKTGGSIGPNVSIENVTVPISILGGVVVTGGQPEIIQGDTGKNELRPVGWRNMLSQTDAGISVPSRSRGIVVDDVAGVGVPVDSLTQSYDTQQVMLGLSAIANSTAPVLARSLGRRSVTVASGATFVDVVLPGLMASTNAAFASGPTAVTDAGATLPTRLYFVATTLIGQRGLVGETGVPYTIDDVFNATPVNTVNYKSLNITLGQRIDMTFSVPSQPELYKRRVYLGLNRGNFLGYVEMAATVSSYSMLNGGFTARGFPPGATGVIRSQQEVDTNYSVFPSLPWDNGGYWISNKTATGFRINWKTAPSSATTLDYLIARLG